MSQSVPRLSLAVGIVEWFVWQQRTLDVLCSMSVNKLVRPDKYRIFPSLANVLYDDCQEIQVVAHPANVFGTEILVIDRTKFVMGRKQQVGRLIFIFRGKRLHTADYFPGPGATNRRCANPGKIEIGVTADLCQVARWLYLKAIQRLKDLS